MCNLSLWNLVWKLGGYFWREIQQCQILKRVLIPTINGSRTQIEACARIEEGKNQFNDPGCAKHNRK